MGGQRGHAMMRRHPGVRAADGADAGGAPRAEWTDNYGVMRTSWGTCELRAAPGLLTLRATAPDAESLGRVKELIGFRLERFGRRDRLKVIWLEQEPTAEAGHA
jgi:hypothetical protein